MVVLGVPHIVPLAVFVLLGGFIPYIGPFIAMAAVVLVALGTVGWQATLVLLVLMLVANGIVNNFLRPIVYSRSVSLHPGIILIAIPAGAAIAGIIGVFAAIPATAFAVAMGGALVEALEPEDQPEERLVAGWLDRLAQWSWRLLVAFGVIALMVFVVARRRWSSSRWWSRSSSRPRSSRLLGRSAQGVGRRAGGDRRYRRNVPR